MIRQQLVPDILRLSHDEPASGHLGQGKTLWRVQRRFYWPRLTKAVQDWCRQCAKCATRKPPVPSPRAPLVEDERPEYPLQWVAIDIVGPLPTSLKGNKYIAVVADYFFTLDGRLCPSQPGSGDSCQDTSTRVYLPLWRPAKFALRPRAQFRIICVPEACSLPQNSYTAYHL